MQIYSNFDKIFSKNQCGFPKGYDSYDRKNENITR